MNPENLRKSVKSMKVLLGPGAGAFLYVSVLQKLPSASQCCGRIPLRPGAK